VVVETQVLELALAVEVREDTKPLQIPHLLLLLQVGHTQLLLVAGVAEELDQVMQKDQMVQTRSLLPLYLLVAVVAVQVLLVKEMAIMAVLVAVVETITVLEHPEKEIFHIVHHLKETTQDKILMVVQIIRAAVEEGLVVLVQTQLVQLEEMVAQVHLTQFLDHH